MLSIQLTSVSTERGFTVGPWMEHMWKEGQHLLTRSENPHGKDLLILERETEDGAMNNNSIDEKSFRWRSPMQKDVFVNAKLGKVMRLMAQQVGVSSMFVGQLVICR